MITEKFQCLRDGRKIIGNVYRPEGTNLPIMIVSHGFLGTGKTVRKEAQRFAAMGFVAVACDFIGGGIGSRSEGDSTEMSVLTEVEDLLAIIEAARNLPYADGNDLSLCGCSQGGFVSAIVAARLQEKIRRLILFYPALCIPDDARKGSMMFARFDPADVPETLCCGPMMLGRRYVTDMLEVDPYEMIRDYAGPVLILHGTEDEIVPLSYAEQAFDHYLARRGGVPDANCQLVKIYKANHGFRGPNGRKWLDFVFFAIAKFLEGKAPIMNVDVTCTEFVPEKIPGGKRVEVYFEGTADSPFFQGTIRPRPYDEQVYKGRARVSCRAAYTVDGTDYTGRACSVSIVNFLQRTEGKIDWAKGWVPTVSSDSPNLSFLAAQQCETYAEMRETGPFIHIFAKPE